MEENDEGVECTTFRIKGMTAHTSHTAEPMLSAPVKEGQKCVLNVCEVTMNSVALELMIFLQYLKKMHSLICLTTIRLRQVSHRNVKK